MQDAVHRIQPRELTQQTMSWARELGFRSINLDLIYGLPTSNRRVVRSNAGRCLGIAAGSIGRVQLCPCAVGEAGAENPGTKALPSAAVKLQLLKRIIERLTDENRYVYIGMDHFARPSDELAVAQRNKRLQRNFQGYSTHADADIYSFGMSAISQIPDAYWQNEKDLLQYYAGSKQGKVPLAGGYLLSDEDKIRREIIMRVMCDLSLDFIADFPAAGINFASHFEREIERIDDFEADSLIRWTPTVSKSPTWPPVHPQHRHVFRPHPRWPRASLNIRELYEISCDYRRRHHRIDRRVLSETQRNPGHCLRSQWARRRRYPIDSRRRLSGRVWTQYDSRNIAENYPTHLPTRASSRVDSTPIPKPEARYVVRYQRPIAMPSSPMGFLTTRLFTANAKLAVAREPFVAARRDWKGGEHRGICRAPSGAGVSRPRHRCAGRRHLRGRSGETLGATGVSETGPAGSNVMVR